MKKSKGSWVSNPRCYRSPKVSLLQRSLSQELLISISIILEYCQVAISWKTHSMLVIALPKWLKHQVRKYNFIPSLTRSTSSKSTRSRTPVQRRTTQLTDPHWGREWHRIEAVIKRIKPEALWAMGEIISRFIQVCHSQGSTKRLKICCCMERIYQLKVKEDKKIRPHQGRIKEPSTNSMPRIWVNQGLNIVWQEPQFRDRYLWMQKWTLLQINMCLTQDFTTLITVGPIHWAIETVSRW